MLNAHKQRDIGDDGSKNKTLERQKLRSIPFSFSSVFFLSLCSFSLAALLWCVLFDSFISISSSLMLLAFYSFFFSLSSLLFSFRIRMCARRASYFDSICKTYRLNRLRYVVQSRNIFFCVRPHLLSVDSRSLVVFISLHSFYRHSIFCSSCVCSLPYVMALSLLIYHSKTIQFSSSAYKNTTTAANITYAHGTIHK